MTVGVQHCENGLMGTWTLQLGSQSEQQCALCKIAGGCSCPVCREKLVPCTCTPAMWIPVSNDTRSICEQHSSMTNMLSLHAARCSVHLWY